MSIVISTILLISLETVMEQNITVSGEGVILLSTLCVTKDMKIKGAMKLTGQYTK
jgi:hypothetical protein